MPTEAARILVLGAGFAGIATARTLERILRENEAIITVVGRENFSLFTPMLPEVSAGGIELRHVVTPVRAQLRRAQFVLGEVVAIDLDARSVEVSHSISGARRTLGYDHLVLALGSVTSTFGIPGVAEHAVPLKTLEDAERLRNRVIASLELADITTDADERRRLLTYAIVGGGYTGCEAVGELADLFRSVVSPARGRKFFRSIELHELRIVLIESGGTLLPGLPPVMGRYTARSLGQRGIELVLGDAVARIDERAIQLASGRTISTATVLWSAGVRPPPLVAELPLDHARNGGVLVGRDFAVTGRPGVWALGDCAWIPTARPDEWYPPTAQHALREGPALARNIAAVMHGRPAEPFDFTALGTMASLGARRGVAALANGTVLTGFVAWFLWRTYYLLRLPGLDRKVRVGLDWALGLLFRRDIAQLRVFTERARAAAARDAGLV
jgi:NADH dehydrogenase